MNAHSAEKDAGEYPDVLSDDVPVPVAWWWTEQGRSQRIAGAKAEALREAADVAALTYSADDRVRLSSVLAWLRARADRVTSPGVGA